MNHFFWKNVFNGCDASQGCQMVYFYTKNPYLRKFWRVLEWKMLLYYMTILNILRPFGIFYSCLV
jgi:hypothetical protein